MPLQYAEVWSGLTSAAHMCSFAPAINASAEEGSPESGSRGAARVSRLKSVAATSSLHAAASASDWAARNTQSGTGVGMLDVQLAGAVSQGCNHHCSTREGTPVARATVMRIPLFCTPVTAACLRCRLGVARSNSTRARCVPHCAPLRQQRRRHPTTSQGAQARAGHAAH